ncbi:hypothetical protein [Chryseobacterium soldanellicola]|uniref:hypothetical protein n=1 Tax=Chryseobacterium soldanellicola TaxID=311333 RepID=UPI001113F280|nr:hypothetical protein [Chryseobacterium soldanellicola]
MTRAQLAAKDAAYTATQNGALTFVNTLDGTAAGKTVNVTATGFYYYDAPNTVWVAVGGGGASTPQRYEGIRGTATVVTATSHTVGANDYFIETTAPAAVTVSLPAAGGANTGRVVVVSNMNTANSTVTVIDASGTAIAGTATVLQFRGKHFISDGTRWVSISYN